MLMIEPTTAVRLSFDPTSTRRLSHSGSFSVAWNKFQRSADASHARSCNYVKNRKIRASAEDPRASRYHPFEEVAEPELIEGGESRLTLAERTRTIIEVNSRATLMFSGFLGDEVHENIFWPDLPYVTDEHANIYFQVKNDEDILQTLTAEDNYQVIIGLDTPELVRELDVSGPTAIHLDTDENDDEESDDDEDDADVDEDEDDEDEDYDEEWVSDLEDDEGEEDDDDDESLGDWAKLDTMRTSHPMYFAKRLAEVVTVDPVDCMDQPPDGLVIQGLLRPALIEEHSVIQKHIADHNSGTSDLKQTGIHDEDKVENLGIINDDRQLSQDSSTSAEELEKGESLGNGTSFYKLEMIKIELISSQGQQSVEVQDLRKAKPDAIAHSAANIISRLKAGGEKTTQALKSLCWRCKGIQVEEASIIGVDTLGFDLRISSGKQIQTLRFTFNARASSEYSAERQLNDLLFPRTHYNPQKKREASQTEL
ncbi:uncharacterized protein At3g49140-like isoform X2 [Rhododendron vialii]|uniref:uncharacterized protein At3g49140-like isoform X2 n=1 Tax=Rhododendron vialii TaxID=182163 RepID=UPI00265F3869|nr:uncharacterized protein At3g49140-like isoform X2 [Rhododendron vialii]